jgi:peptidoglycan/xylan/chitin deacetylase (PgdA/CDA1 family)
MPHRSSGRLLGALALALVVFALSPSAAAPAPQSASVALTFDDLPSHGPIPMGLTRVEIANRIIAALRAVNAPPIYGFINARQLESKPEDEEVLKVWRAAGYPLANHAYSHMDLHANPADAFQQDVLKNETELQKLMAGQDWRWFRYPYLREGDTTEKYRSVRTFLDQQKYKIAQVTLDFSDYAFNDPYARCLAANNTAGIDQLKEMYLTRAALSLTRGQDFSKTLFGRDIKHIMLLHIGGFETVMMPHLLTLLKERGFTLTTLADAASDEAYKSEVVLPQNYNGTFLGQLMNAKSLPRPPADDFFAKLGAMCK